MFGQTSMFLYGVIVVLGISLITIVAGEEGKPLYTDVERQQLEKLRTQILTDNVTMHDYQMEDKYLIRWLRAKNMDLNAAYRMLVTALRWRKHNSIDGILNETIVTFNPLPYRMKGSDMEGNPLVTFTPTNLDLRRLLINGKNISRYWDRILEEASLMIRERDNATEKHITQVTCLMDLYGFNLRQHGCLACFGVYIDWITDYENYYPGLARNLIWVNAPRVFVVVLNLVKPLMSPATSKALKVFASNRQEWSAYVYKLIPRDQLTTRFGGPHKV